MKIFLEPNDVLMFRDGKPFSGGDDHFARSIFPPSPSTLYGAIRSKFLSEKYPQYENFKIGDIPEDIKEAVGTPLLPGSLAITNFFTAKRVGGLIQLIFPIPKDIVKLKMEGKESLFVLKREEEMERKIKTNLPSPVLSPLWLKTEEPLEEIRGFLSQEMIDKYLCGGVPDRIIKHSDLYQKDERVGIRKDRIRRTSAAGALYSVEYIRLDEGVGFALEFTSIKDFPKEGFLRLGGDHRSAYYKEIDFSVPGVEAIKQMVESSKRFKVILLTPAIFSKGWIPDWIDIKSGEGRINDLSLKLVSAATGRSIHLGGFDIVKGMPKIMKKAVPAGSVYCFEMKEGDINKVFEVFWLKSISTEKQNEGFGISIIGGY
jgi:CRISPR-associated protein Cmr3